jgi:cytochrome P450
LARTELRIAFEIILARMEHFKLTAEPTYHPSYIAYGPRVLPLEFSKKILR